MNDELDVKTCLRPGCGKTLRRDNAKGVCSTNCKSPDAPLGQQSREVNGGDSTSTSAPSSSPRVSTDSALKRFKLVAAALGKNPEAILEEFAEEWLEQVLKAIEER